MSAHDTRHVPCGVCGQPRAKNDPSGERTPGTCIFNGQRVTACQDCINASVLERHLRATDATEDGDAS